MRYRVNVMGQDGRSGGWSVVEASSAQDAVTAVRVDWDSRFPLLSGVEEETHEPKTAYRVEVVSDGGTSGDRVYKEATSPEIATELVLAQYPDFLHKGTYLDDPA